MERVIVTKPMVGICWMQVCVVREASDEEILEFCNRENPSGTQNGWGSVLRQRIEGEQAGTVQCADHAERVHLLVQC